MPKVDKLVVHKYSEYLHEIQVLFNKETEWCILLIDKRIPDALARAGEWAAFWYYFECELSEIVRINKYRVPYTWNYCRGGSISAPIPGQQSKDYVIPHPDLTLGQIQKLHGVPS